YQYVNFRRIFLGEKRGTIFRIPKERKTIKPLPKKRAELQGTKFVPCHIIVCSSLPSDCKLNSVLFSKY
ncbi:hypothetical protein, partial [Phocaeicola dorei]|uniref:hypothetical protein n=1 Tax=Phocaeicola dorei TaxID=357276 RepID=UPI0032EB60DF